GHRTDRILEIPVIQRVLNVDEERCCCGTCAARVVPTVATASAATIAAAAAEAAAATAAATVSTAATTTTVAATTEVAATVAATWESARKSFGISGTFSFAKNEASGNLEVCVPGSRAVKGVARYKVARRIGAIQTRNRSSDRRKLITNR